EGVRVPARGEGSVDRVRIGPAGGLVFQRRCSRPWWGHREGLDRAVGQKVARKAERRKDGCPSFRLSVSLHRFPSMTSLAHAPITAPTGTTLTCKGWHQEAALR